MQRTHSWVQRTPLITGRLHFHCRFLYYASSSVIGGDSLLSFNSKLAVLVCGADVWIKKVRHAHLILVNLPPPHPVSLSASVWQQPSQPHAFAVVHRWVPPLSPLDLYSCFQASSRHRKAQKCQISEKKQNIKIPQEGLCDKLTLR